MILQSTVHCYKPYKLTNKENMFLPCSQLSIQIHKRQGKEPKQGSLPKQAFGQQNMNNMVAEVARGRKHECA